jgi:hypothetical protein
METWRHLGTNDLYELLCSGRLEADGATGKRMIVYRSVADRRIWIRPAKEFYGRFELVQDVDTFPSNHPKPALAGQYTGGGLID